MAQPGEAHRRVGDWIVPFVLQHFVQHPDQSGGRDGISNERSPGSTERGAKSGGVCPMAHHIADDDGGPAEGVGRHIVEVAADAEPPLAWAIARMDLEARGMVVVSVDEVKRARSGQVLSGFLLGTISHVDKVLFTKHLSVMLRAGLTLSVVGVLVGEILGARRGLGYLINDAYGRFRTTDYAALAVLALLIVLVVDGAAAWTERRARRWTEGAAP